MMAQFDANDKVNFESCVVRFDEWLASSARENTTPGSPQTSHTSQPALPPIPKLTPWHYVNRSIILQAREYAARKEALAECSLHGIFIRRLQTPIQHEREYPASGGIPPALFAIEAPHFRENYPPLAIGDTVWLRQLRPWDRTTQGIAFEARIHTLQRISNIVIVRCDELGAPGVWESGIFNIEWVPQLRHFNLCRSALENLSGDILNGATTEDFIGVLRSGPTRWLFPKKDDWDERTAAVSQTRPSMNWIDYDLNEEQKVRLCPVYSHINDV
jgi:hypothetical protein